MVNKYKKGDLLLGKKKRVNSKRKGNAFQNKIAKILKERFNSEDFANTPGSGAYATTHSLPEHLKIYGDLITPKNFKFIFECKKGYSKESFDTILSDDALIWSWVEQSERDSLASSKPSLIILSQDRRPTLAFIKKELIKDYLNTEIQKYSILINKDRVYIMLLFEDLLKLETSFFTN